MNNNFDPINLFLSGVTGNLRFLNQFLTMTGAIVLITGIVLLLVFIF